MIYLILFFVLFIVSYKFCNDHQYILYWINYDLAYKNFILDKTDCNYIDLLKNYNSLIEYTEKKYDAPLIRSLLFSHLAMPNIITKKKLLNYLSTTCKEPISKYSDYILVNN